MNQWLLYISFSIIVFCSSISHGIERSVISHTGLGSIGKQPSFKNHSTSPDASHYAYATSTALYVDGKEVLQAHMIAPGSLAWSPDGGTVAIWGHIDGNWKLCVYTVDSKKLKEAAGYPTLIVRSFRKQGFYKLELPDAMSIRSSNGGETTMKGPGLQTISPSKSMWYGLHDKSDAETPAAMGYVVMGNAGRPVAWPALNRRIDKRMSSEEWVTIFKDGPWEMIVDGVSKFGKWDYIWPAGVRLSPNGRVLAFVGMRKGKFYVVSGSRRDGPWDNLSSVSFSRNSKHDAYMAKSGSKTNLVIDGRATVVECNNQSRVLVSEVGEAIAWPCKKAKDRWVLERPIKGNNRIYEYIVGGSLTLAPSSNGYAWEAWTGSKSFIIDKDVQGTGYETVRKPIFSPNGKHLAYVAKLNKEAYGVVVNKELGPIYSWIVGDPFFVDENTIRYVVIEDMEGETKVQVVLERLVSN